MQTAVEFLIQQIVKPINNEYTEHSLYEKALELEKKQIIDAYTEGNRLEFYDASETIGKQYYNETYGSKGSDESKGGELATFNTSSQTEISDEDIMDEADKIYKKHYQVKEKNK